MKKSLVYDLVMSLLESYPILRDSDKLLLWNVWGELGLLSSLESTTCLTKEAFLKAPTPETITRCRRKIQELHPELGPSVNVKKARAEKAETGGNFIFREEDGQGSLI
jgi:hypothetical protein